MDIIARHNKNILKQIEHVNNGTTDQAEGVMEVPVSNYTDAERFAHEKELIFKKLPLFVGLTHELPEPGDYKTIDMVDVPLLIVRQKNGEVQVMINACSHRGMKLSSEAYGKKGVFTCPYHGWAFNADGGLRGIAEAKKFGEVDKSQRGLTVLPSYERAGFIFAVLTPGLEVNFEEFLEGMIDDVEQLNLSSFNFYGTRSLRGANWKVAYDGYLEGYHFAAAHPDTIYPRTYSNIMEFDCYGPHLLIGFPQRSINKLEEVPLNDLYKYENDGFDFIRLFFPNVSIFVAPEVTQIAQLIPGEKPNENKTIMYYLHHEKYEGEELANYEKTIDWIWKVVEEEDYGLGLKVQQGLDAAPYETVIFGRNERGNQHFHKWVNYYLAEDDNAPKPEL